MKIKIYTLLSDIHNTGTDVTVFGSQEDLENRLVRIMEAELRARMAHYKSDQVMQEACMDVFQTWENYGVMEGWKYFIEDNGTIRHPDDSYQIEEHEVDVPSTTLKMLSESSPQQS